MGKSGEELIARFKHLLYIYACMRDNGVRKPFSKVNLREQSLINDFRLMYQPLIERCMHKGIITRVTDWYHYVDATDKANAKNAGIDSATLTGETYKYGISLDAYRTELLEILSQPNACTRIFNWINDHPRVQMHLPIIPFARNDFNMERTRTLSTGEVIRNEIEVFRLDLWGMYGDYLNDEDREQFWKAREKYFEVNAIPKRKNAKQVTVSEKRGYYVDGKMIPHLYYEVAYVETLCDMILQYFDLPIKRRDMDLTKDIKLLASRTTVNGELMYYRIKDGISRNALYLYTLHPMELSIRGSLADSKSQEIENYKIVARDTLLECSPILLLLRKEVEAIKNLNGLSTINLHIDFKINKKSFRVKASGRQWNAVCDTDSRKREKLFSREGIDGNFDLHSAIFSVARLMNTGKFDANWDIKTQLLGENTYYKKDGTVLTRDELKTLMMRLFFKKSYEDMERLYDLSFWLPQKTKSDKQSVPSIVPTKYSKQKPKPPKLEHQSLKELNAAVEDIIGPTEPYYYNVFLIESIIELRVIRKFLEQGKKIHNVYDCFYYSLDEFPNEKDGGTSKEVIKIINDAAMSVYNDLSQYLDSGSLFIKTLRDELREKYDIYG